jgi:hypothetical protein
MKLLPGQARQVGKVLALKEGVGMANLHLQGRLSISDL